MLKHRVQHPPPAAQTATTAETHNLTVPPGPGNRSRSATPTGQAQSRSRSGTPTRPAPPIPTAQAPAQPRPETPTHAQIRPETPTQVQPLPDTPTHGRSYTDSPKHGKPFVPLPHPGGQAHVKEGRSDSFSMQTRSETLNNIKETRSGSFSSHVPQSRSEYSMTSNHIGPGERMSMSSSYDAKEGVKRINEKYDSLSNISGSPYRTSVGSPGLDGLQFNFTDIVTSQKFREGINEEDLLQIETFYKSHKTEVYVCGCLANMYFGSMKSTISNDHWTFSATGIPLLLLDTGEHRRERKLFMLLAEKGTGFTLWRDTIDKNTGYRTPNPNFHTMRTSSDNSRIAGFSFDDAAAAAVFYNHIDKLTAEHFDELLPPGGKLKKKKSMKEKLKKIKLPKKSEISQPCCFVHVTKLDNSCLGHCGEDHLPQEQQQQQQQQQQHQVQQQQPQPIPQQQMDGSIEGSEYISQPFNFQNMTGGKAVTDNNVNSGDISNMVESKLTIDSNDSFDSGLPEKS